MNDATGPHERAQDDLRGRTALITGAARRVGRHLALAMATVGIRVVIHYRHSKVEAASLADEIAALKGLAALVDGDLTEAAVSEGLIARAEAAGYTTLMVTADVPAAGKRDRDIRNQLAVPFRFTPEVILQCMVNPRWALTSLQHGTPNVANYADLLKSATSYADVQKTLITPGFTWEDLKRLRARWKGRLLVKGILHAKDAVACAALGCDGIVVSNHGGRQVAFGPPTIEALPAIAKAVAGRMTIILDSGIRRGADILRAKALGADFTLAGRVFAYGVGAGGDAGARRAFEILQLELVRALGQLGIPSYEAVGPSELRGCESF